MKKILSTIIAIFCSVIFLIGCADQEQNKEAIEKVLTQDANTGSINNDSIDGYCSSIETKCKKMREIDLSDCPPEFQTAYIAHTSAWKQKLQVAYELKAFDNNYNSFAGFVVAFLRGFTFDFGIMSEVSRAAEKIREHDIEANNAISSTYNDVLKVAAKYDVDVSKYR